VPAPAVTPALVAYINTVVVKTLVVDPRIWGLNSVLTWSHVAPCYNGDAGFMVGIHGIWHLVIQVVQVWVLTLIPILVNGSPLAEAIMVQL